MPRPVFPEDDILSALLLLSLWKTNTSKIVIYLNFRKTYLSFFGKSENHILKIGCDDLKCTIALMIQKKEKYSRSFQYKALIDYYHYFCFKTFFLSFIISNVHTVQTYQIFDWYTNRFNEIMLERNKYENMCSKIFVVVF